MPFTGAEIIVHTLEREGVRLVAGIPGGALLPLYEALGRSALIRHVLVRHEQAAGFIAQGMARMTGKAGVCFATSGPGVTNVITALADAKLDSIPMVCIAGQVPTHLIGTDAFQEVATVDMAKPVTKAAFAVHRPEELKAAITEALRIAESGRPGPVLVDVPKDVQIKTAAVHCKQLAFLTPLHGHSLPPNNHRQLMPGTARARNHDLLMPRTPRAPNHDPLMPGALRGGICDPLTPVTLRDSNYGQLTPSALRDGNRDPLTPGTLRDGDYGQFTPSVLRDSNCDPFTPGTLRDGDYSQLTPSAPSDCSRGPLAREHEVLYEEAAEMIRCSERPVLYIGGGVTKARAFQMVRQLAERCAIPVTTTLMALGTLPSDHELNLGMLGMHGARFTNMVLDECDLVIAIGARFDDRATGRPDRFVPRACIIHIDIDARELGKIKQHQLGICDDAGTALRELLSRNTPASRTQWLRRVADLRHQYPLHTPGSDDICSPYGIVRAAGELAPTDSIVTTDVGQHQMWVAQAYPFERPDRWLTSGGLGTMGFGLPAAMGAALAEPDSTAICFTGDGSLLMNIQELATLAELNLNVKIIVLDNAALGLVRQQQELFYHRQLTASTFAKPTDFVALAKAFGIPAFDLQSTAAPYGALANALSRKGPTLIRVPIAAEHHVLPMVAPGAANTEALDHAVAFNAASSVLDDL